MADDPPEGLLDELRTVALSVATGAAEVLMRYSTAVLSEVTTKSSPTDLVSEADRASEAHIASALQNARPDDSVLAEEGASHEGTSEVRWVADPLDGTTNFFFGVPEYSVSLAAQWRGEPVVGVVVDPCRRETWLGVRGQGAWCNGTACHVANNRSQLATALVATGFSYQADRRAEQASVLRELLPLVRDIRRFGSAALDLCWVASGRLDGYYESWLNDWDWAAGKLICREAGAAASLLRGDTLVVSTPELHEAMTDLVARAQERAARA